MHLPRSSALAPRLDALAQTGSTNAELVTRASAGRLDHFAVLVTTDQTAGRGRLGRAWVAPAGTCLAASVFLGTGDVHPDRLGWLPLLAGLAMTRAVASLLDGHEVGLKWPNDVLVDELKVSGILAELVPGAGVVIGAGLNLTIAQGQLPTPTSTSLALNGWAPGGGVADDELVDAALSAYLVELDALYFRLAAADFDAGASGVRAEVASACTSIGRTVRVELPDGTQLLGTATGIDESGRLVVGASSAGGERAVAAGDVTHLRHA